MSDPSDTSQLKAIKSSQLQRSRNNTNSSSSRRPRGSSGNTRRNSDALSSDDEDDVRPRRGIVDENTGEQGNRSAKSRQRSSSERKPGVGKSSSALTAEKGDKLAILRERIKLRDRSPNEREPEVFIVGEIESGTGFVGGGAAGTGSSGACVKWRLDTGPTWELLGGYSEGQSHVDFPSSAVTESGSPECVWCHPIDLHLSCKGLAEWPRLLLQVWKMDEHGRLDLSGYAFVHVPAQPGHHSLSVPTWRPMGSLHEEVAAFFLGGTPQLRDVNVLFTKAWSDRCRLNTSSSGTIRLNLDVVLRHFQENQVDI
jgi:B9 domain-containing protein 2